MTSEQLKRGNELVAKFKSASDTLKTIEKVRKPNNTMPANLYLSAKVSSDFDGRKVFMVGDYIINEEKFKKITENIEAFLKEEMGEIEKEFERL